MRCPNCGQLLSDGAGRCPACDTIIDESMRSPFTENTENVIETEGSYHEEYTGEYTEPSVEDTEEEEYDDSDVYVRRPWRIEKKTFDRGMKWFWFLTRISLLLTFVMNVLSGLEAILGMQYSNSDGTAYDVYGTFPLMKPCDVIYGILIVAFGAFAFYTRYQLMRYRKKGPKCVMLLYLFSAIITVGYCAIVSLITGSNCITGSIIFSATFSILMVVLNKIYFDNRKHIFRY